MEDLKQLQFRDIIGSWGFNLNGKEKIYQVINGHVHKLDADIVPHTAHIARLEDAGYYKRLKIEPNESYLILAIKGPIMFCLNEEDEKVFTMTRKDYWPPKETK